MMSIIISKLKSFILLLVNIFRRAMCCFRRRRRMSGDVEPLSHIVVNEASNTVDMEQWNDWEFMNRKPSNVQEHIEYYRQQQAKLVKQQSFSESVSEEGDGDLFSDMAPKITKQKKVLVGKSEASRGYSMNVQHDADNFVTNELENWEDNSGWEKENLDWDTQNMLREKKRLEREKRVYEQHQKRLEKGSRPNVLGAKIGS